MGYDVELIQVPEQQGLSFPVPSAQAETLAKKPVPFSDPAAVREALLKVAGCRPGPNDAVDYIGRGMNYARFFIREDRIYVENNCGPGELLKVHEHLATVLPGLLIFDLQSRRLHNPESFKAWWAKPL